MIDSSSSSPTPPPSSSTHLCLIAKGERNVSNNDDSSDDEHASDDDSDSDDDEYESPTYDDLARLLKQYTKIIIKTRAKNEKLEAKNDSLLSLEKQMMIYHPNSRSSNLLRKSLKINMINLRGYIMSSSLAKRRIYKSQDQS